LTQENPTADTIRINARMVKLAIATFAFTGGIGTGLWATAQWKTSVDDHLQRIEDHLQNEDTHIEEEHEQLQWLVEHNRDRDPAPSSHWTPSPSRNRKNSSASNDPSPDN
jgi:hypothetical protein